jgi:hypothetical protein
MAVHDGHNKDVALFNRAGLLFAQRPRLLVRSLRHQIELRRDAELLPLPKKRESPRSVSRLELTWLKRTMFSDSCNAEDPIRYYERLSFPGRRLNLRGFGATRDQLPVAATLVLLSWSGAQTAGFDWRRSASVRPALVGT